MTISLSDAGKRFNREWIFRHFTYDFEPDQSYAITGPNGSGKSTLLQVLSGSLMVNQGRIQYLQRGLLTTVKTGEGPAASITYQPHILPAEQVYRHVSICAPYLEVVEEMTLTEFLDFHRVFKPCLPGVTVQDIIAQTGLEKAANKQIRYYSSGMKQRVKLAQCIFSDTDIVLLDEPCTNLDTDGIALYHRLISDFCQKRLVIVSSNDKVEYEFCKKKLSILDWK